MGLLREACSVQPWACDMGVAFKEMLSCMSGPQAGACREALDDVLHLGQLAAVGLLHVALDVGRDAVVVLHDIGQELLPHKLQQRPVLLCDHRVACMQERWSTPKPSV